MAKRSRLALGIALAWAVAACTGQGAEPGLSAERAPLISRTDSRQAPDAVADAAFAAEARSSVAALVLSDSVEQDRTLLWLALASIVAARARAQPRFMIVALSSA